MDFSEVASVLIDYATQNGYEDVVLENIDIFIDELKNNTDLVVEKLEDFKRQYSLDNGLCFECGGNIVVTNGFDEVVEYNGFPERQKVYIRQCEKCGRILN